MTFLLLVAIVIGLTLVLHFKHENEDLKDELDLSESIIRKQNKDLETYWRQQGEVFDRKREERKKLYERWDNL